MCPRRYDMRRRSVERAETRRRIVEAAIGQIERTGSGAPFTLEAVAAEAGVAPMTVYNQFGSKRGLVGAVLDAVADEQFHGDLERAFTDPDPKRAMAVFVGTFPPFYQRYRTLFRSGRAIARLDPPLFKVIRARERRRRGGLKLLLRRRGRKYAPSEERQLLDLLEALTGFDFFDSLAPARGAVATVHPVILAQVEAAIEGSRPPSGPPVAH
jgi:AcrR family transcriptional regulator